MSTKIKTISALALLMAGMAATPAMAEAGDTFIRVRGIMVAPNEDSTGITPAFPAETVSVDNAAGEHATCRIKGRIGTIRRHMHACEMGVMRTANVECSRHAAIKAAVVMNMDKY